MSPSKTSHPSNVTAPASHGLTSPLESILTSGGDLRLRLNPVDLLNGYGCQPWPRPEAFTFASSTATSISDRGFAAGAEAQQGLIELARSAGLEEACDRYSECVREELKALLRLDASRVQVVFSPSGTDSQVHALYVAQTVLRGQGPLVSVIVGSDETGSGTDRAMVGCHFSSSTAQGAAVIEGQRIPGFAENTEKIEIPLRDPCGRLRSRAQVDREVIAAIEQAVASGKSVVLHVMDRSKLGSRSPTLDCLRHATSTWPRSVQVVVDACQMRLGRRRLRHYLDQGFIVLITGSKFFTGPPLSGALLIPAEASSLMKRAVVVPPGLRLYSNRTDWPIHWNTIRSEMPASPNVGQLLRWVAAIEEMRAYFTVPEFYRVHALREFSRIVPQLIAEKPSLQSLPAFEEAGTDRLDDEELAEPTIFPFFISDRGKFLSVDACHTIYRALNRDVSSLLPASATSQQRKVAARLCHIGQPVGVPVSQSEIAGTLRISAGSRVVSETWSAAGESVSARKLAQEFDQVRTILDKIELLVENLGALADRDAAAARVSARASEALRRSSASGAGAALRSAGISAV
jgi:hypothetical protein